MYRLLIAFGMVYLLTGCEMAGEARDMTGDGSSAFSCEQISAAFAAYDADRSSFDALAELSGMTGFEITRSATQTADTYYDKARSSANLALIVKGCEPLQ